MQYTWLAIMVNCALLQMRMIDLDSIDSGQRLGLFRMLAKKLRDDGILSYACDGLYTELRASFLDDRFECIFQECISADTRSCLGDFQDIRDKAFRWRLHILLQAAQYAIKPGALFLDLGCGSGMIGSALLKLLSFDFLSNNISYHMFDSFEGPKPDDTTATNFYDSADGAFEMASRVASRYSECVKLHRGYLPHALVELDVHQLEKVSFISLDLNSAKPEIGSLRYLIDHLLPGCVIVLDDFGFPGSIEQNVQHRQFCADRGLPLFHLPTGQGLILIGE